MTAETDLLPELVAEGLDFFDLAGDEGDKLYVSAIRQHIAAKDAENERLRAEVERLRADRDSWEQQASDRVADWHAEHLRAERLAEALRLIESAKDRGFGIDYARGVAQSALRDHDQEGHNG